MRLGLWSWALTQAILDRHPSLIPPLPLPSQVLLPAKSFGNPCTYTIRPGDSLWGLSQVGLKWRAVVCVTCVKGAKGVGGGLWQFMPFQPAAAVLCIPAAPHPPIDA